MAVDNYVVALGDNELMFVTQRVWCVADQIEQSIAPGLDVCTVLYVVRRPELLSGSVVPLVKQGVERFEHQLFVFLLYRLIHNTFPILSSFWPRSHASKIVRCRDARQRRRTSTTHAVKISEK